MRRALLCLLLLTLPALGQPWQTYSSAQDGFQVSAPGAFEVERDGSGGQSYYTLSRSEQSGVMVVVSMRPDSDTRDPNQVLEQACQGGAAGIGAEILSQQPLQLNGTPGLACSLATDAFNISVRFYLTKGRLYQLISTTSKSEPPWPEEQQFFDSFQVIAD